MQPPDDHDPYTMDTGNPRVESAYSPSPHTGRVILYALYLTFKPHWRNSPTRKWLTGVLSVTWAVVTVLQWLGFAASGEYSVEIYWLMTVTVFSIVSHQWGFEYGVLSTVTAEKEERGDDETD